MSTVGRFELMPMLAGHILKEPAFLASNPRVFARRLQQEWKMLRGEVPLDVLVKASEEESHLMKVAIIGAKHTPYYQAFMCFDIRLSADYPVNPPAVRFHSYGRRLNPNLYEDGYVCLSVLGTWTGMDACERWNPVASNILQIIFAVQATILCQEPYYNEAGYESRVGTPDGQAHSRMGNEMLFFEKLKHMMAMAQGGAPPDWCYELRTHMRTVVPQWIRRMKKYSSDTYNETANALAMHQYELQAAASGNRTPAYGAFMNIDGLVLPLSGGFRKTLTSHILWLEKEFSTVVAKWDEEEARNDAAFVGDA